MKYVSHKKGWSRFAVHIHVDPPPIPLIKSKNDEKIDRYCVRINCVGILSQKTYLCEFKMALFENGNPEEFLVFVCNLQMMLET